MPTFKHNDIVRVTRGRHAGRLGSIHEPVGLVLGHCCLKIDGVGYVNDRLPEFWLNEVEATGFALGDFATLSEPDTNGVFPQTAGVIMGIGRNDYVDYWFGPSGGCNTVLTSITDLIKLELSISSTDADGLATYTLTPVKEI